MKGHFKNDAWTHDGLDVRVVHGGPAGREPSDAPAVQDDLLRVEAQPLDRELENPAKELVETGRGAADTRAPD